MKKIAIALTLALSFSATRAYAWGLPSAPAGGGGATAADIDRFDVSAINANNLVGNAAISLVRAVGSKEANEKIEALVVAVKAMPEGAEKEAKKTELATTAAAAAASIDFDHSAAVDAAVNDKAKREQIGNSLHNLAIGSLVNVDLLAQGKKLLSGIPSPDVVSKLDQVKNSLAALGNQATSLGSILSSTKSLLTKVGITALPTKATDKPVDVSSSFQ